MSIVNYEVMSDRELKQYFLAHRNENELKAFHPYINRFHQKQPKILIKA